MQQEKINQTFRAPERPTANELIGTFTEVMEICPKCGEPVIGSAHECGELEKLLQQSGEDSLIYKLYSNIFNQAKRIWNNRKSVSEPVKMIITMSPSREKPYIIPNEF